MRHVAAHQLAGGGRGYTLQLDAHVNTEQIQAHARFSNITTLHFKVCLFFYTLWSGDRTIEFNEAQLD